MLSKTFLLLISLLYPLLWYIGREQGWFPYLAGLMMAIWLLRAYQQVERAQKLMALFIATFFLIMLIMRLPQSMYWYPVIVNLLMFLLFAYSLYHPPSMIEKFARLQIPDLPPHAIVYTRHITQIWCIFFIINGSIAAALVLLNQYDAWALYTGVISYLLIGILLGGEWLYRRKVMT